MRKAVYAGSFDPITNGHLWMIEQASKLFDEVVVAVGINPAKQYTFSVRERLDAIERSCSHLRHVTVASFENLFLVRFARQIQAQFIVRGIRNEQDYAFERSMRYVNEELDPDVRSVLLIPPRHLIEVSSSFVKGLVGPDGWETIVGKYVPSFVYQQLLRRFGGCLTAELVGPTSVLRLEAQSLWDRLCDEAGVRKNGQMVFDSLLRAHTGPGRAYHNLLHVLDMLYTIQVCEARPSPAVRFAVWFHDYVYDVTRPDNEERSADAASTALREMGVQHLEDSVQRLILATKHVSPALEDRETQLLVDADLAILGRSPGEFDAYERAIRREYAQISEPAFRAGRAEILRGFLSRPFIYATKLFLDSYEKSARANLARSIETLSRQ